MGAPIGIADGHDVMHITKSTDYSLRTLMLLASLPEDELISIEQISEIFNISRTHLMKIVNQMANLGVVDTVRGRSGGVRLNLAHDQINIGHVFRQLESLEKIVDCEQGPCLFQGSCNLEGAIKKATHAFLDELDQYTLADLVQPRQQVHRLIAQGLR